MWTVLDKGAVLRAAGQDGGSFYLTSPSFQIGQASVPGSPTAWAHNLSVRPGDSAEVLWLCHTIPFQTVLYSLAGLDPRPVAVRSNSRQSNSAVDEVGRRPTHVN